MPVTCLLYTLMSGVLNICMCRSRLLQGVQLFATPWTVARQAPLSMGFSRQEYWSGLPCPPPGDLPDPGIEPASPVSPALAGGFFTTSAEALIDVYIQLSHIVVQQKLTQRCKAVILIKGTCTCVTVLPRQHGGKESVCQCRRCGFNPWAKKIPWRR